MSKIDKTQLSSWIKLSQQFYLDPDGFLGKGAFGQVFRGYSIKRDCLVAIKTMQGQGYQREVQTLKALSSLIHPNIMGYYGFVEKEDTVYIFIEFCPNGTLTDFIQNGIEEIKVLEMFRQMIQGFCYMNAKGKMHRDVKPDNILIGMSKDVKISDFGLARQSTNDIRVTGAMGTPLYAAPQVFLKKEEEGYTQKCDVWGAGMILYQMLTGKLLFQNVRTMQHLAKEWKSYQVGQRRVQYPKSLHPNWQFFTNYMLTYDQKKRPSFHQVLQKLKKVYDKMQEEIKNKVVHTINEGTKIGKLQLLLQFFLQKYGVLLQSYQQLKNQVTKIRVQFKYLLQFLLLCNYVVRVKKIIRAIKYKRVKVEDDDEQGLVDQDNHDFDLVLDKYKSLFQHKYDYYNDQITNHLLPKLLQLENKPESGAIIKGLKSVWQLVNDAKDGTFDVQQTYNQSLLDIIGNKLQQHQQGLIQSMQVEQLRVVNMLWLAARVEGVFVNGQFLKRGWVKEVVGKVAQGDKGAVLKEIGKLRKG